MIKIKNYKKVIGIERRVIGGGGRVHFLQINDIVEEGEIYQMRGRYRYINGEGEGIDTDIVLVLSRERFSSSAIIPLKIIQYDMNNGSIELYDERVVGRKYLGDPQKLVEGILLEIIPSYTTYLQNPS